MLLSLPDGATSPNREEKSECKNCGLKERKIDLTVLDDGSDDGKAEEGDGDGG